MTPYEVVYGQAVPIRPYALFPWETSVEETQVPFTQSPKENEPASQWAYIGLTKEFEVGD